VFVKANYSDAFEEPRYMAISESTYQREVVLYNGFRYPERGFERLRTSPGVDRVHSNGEYRLYLVGNESRS